MFEKKTNRLAFQLNNVHNNNTRAWKSGRQKSRHWNSRLGGEERFVAVWMEKRNTRASLLYQLEKGQKPQFFFHMRTRSNNSSFSSPTKQICVFWLFLVFFHPYQNINLILKFIPKRDWKIKIGTKNIRWRGGKSWQCKLPVPRKIRLICPRGELRLYIFLLFRSPLHFMDPKLNKQRGENKLLVDDVFFHPIHQKQFTWWQKFNVLLDWKISLKIWWTIERNSPKIVE